MLDTESFLKFVHPDDLEDFNLSVAESFKENTPLNIGHRIVRPDGTTRFVCERAEFYFDETGRPVKLIGTVQDITESKLAEKSLQENQAFFRSAFDHAAIGVALVSTTGCWMRVNNSLCDIVGYSEQELLATTSQAITHPDDLAPDLNYIRQ